ncbi:MAG: glycosyltransferase [Chlorobia bacterium]|nr:glycosyltransferase [Fimbriimonadaceae bacterium]
MSMQLTDNPFLSVIIPCYKTASTMRLAIDSALDQDGPVEVIVVNDGSPDDTSEIAAEYGQRIVYLEQPNRGVAAARNLGLKHARGWFVQFLDADDKLLPGMASAFKKFADSNASLDVLFSDILIGDDDLETTKPFDIVFEQANPIKEMLLRCCLTTQGTIAKTQAVQDIAGLDDHLAGVDDWDLWLRLAASGASFAKVPGMHSIWRFRTGSQSKQFVRSWNLHQAFFEKHKALYTEHLSEKEMQGLIDHVLDRDLPHLYGNDLSDGWLARRLNRTRKAFKASRQSRGLLRYLLKRSLGNFKRRFSQTS